MSTIDSLDIFLAGYGNGDDTDNATDLVADLLHWCKNNNVSLCTIMRAAESHFYEECRGKGSTVTETKTKSTTSQSPVAAKWEAKDLKEFQLLEQVTALIGQLHYCDAVPKPQLKLLSDGEVVALFKVPGFQQQIQCFLFCDLYRLYVTDTEGHVIVIEREWKQTPEPLKALIVSLSRHLWTSTDRS